MTLPSLPNLPAQGASSWYSHYSGVDAAARLANAHLSWRNIPEYPADAGAYVQALYDAKLPIAGKPGAMYYFQTPVFFDRPDEDGAFGRDTINWGGATIIAGPNLPRASTFSRPANDATFLTAGISDTRWVFFTNVVRSAWNQATKLVTVSDANRASKLYGAAFGSIMRVTMSHYTFKGAYGPIDGNAGFLYANRCGTHIHHYTMRGAATMLSWFDYSDVQILEYGYGRSEQNDGSGRDAVLGSKSFHMHQEDPGDNVVITAIKGGNACYLKRNRGAVITTALAGMRFSECTGVQIDAFHMESQISNEVAIECWHSELNINSSIGYRRGSAGANIEITDTIAEEGSVVTVNNSQQMTFWGGDGPGSTPLTNVPFGPMVDILSATAGTQVIFRDTHAKFASVSVPGERRNAFTNPITASGSTPVATALLANSARALYASGNWKLLQVNGAWRVVPADGQDLIAVLPLPTPTVAAFSNGVSGDTWLGGGTLVEGTVYTYYFTAVDAAGGMTPTVSSTVTVGSTKTVRLRVNGVSNCSVIVWRATGGAGTAPDRYQRLIMGGLPDAYTFDVGAYVDGKAWLTTGIPARPASSTSVRTLLMAGVAIA